MDTHGEEGAGARLSRIAPVILAHAVALKIGRAGRAAPHRVLALGTRAVAAGPAALLILANCRTRSSSGSGYNMQHHHAARCQTDVRLHSYNGIPM